MSRSDESLSALLRDMGVSLSGDDFVGIVREAFEGYAGGRLPVDPEQELPDEELELLRRGGFSEEGAPGEASGDHDPLLRSALDLSALVASALSTRAAAELLGVDPSRIRQRLLDPRPSLYGLKWRGEWLLPRFQFTAEAEVPGLAQVVPHLDSQLSPIAVARWFLSPSTDLVADDPELPMTPREWLLAGHPAQAVAQLAAAL